MNNWQQTTLGEVLKIDELTIDKCYPFDEIEYIDIASVKERRILETQKLRLDDAPSRARRIVRNNDILISTVRPNLKHYCFIKKAVPNLIASTGFAAITAKKSDPAFIYYLLTTDEYTDYLTKIADSHTSAYPSFNPEVIENSKFILPPLPEQKAIAAILSSFDDKVELLRRQNKTLESIAQTIFKKWFVNFNFPDKKGKPYKDNGGKVKPSELGKIPEDWKVGTLGDVIKVIGGGTPKTDIAEYWNGDIPWFSVVDVPNDGNVFVIRCEKHISQKGLEKSSTRLLPLNTTIITARGTVGKLALTGVEMAMNQSCYGLYPKKGESCYYLYLLVKDSLTALKQQVHGAVFDTITKATLDNITCILPADETVSLFENAINPSFQKALENNKQIQTLSKLRDTLLPKLMKGEIRVKAS